MLVEQYGVPKRALRMTVVIDEQGEGHAVLMVRTDEGELILDNKRDAVLAWHQTGYIFVKREGQDSRTLGLARRPLLARHDGEPVRAAPPRTRRFSPFDGEKYESHVSSTG